MSLDLGKDGEPPGVCRLLFAPKLERSDFLELNLRVPLGLLIEETDAGDVVINGALPGYGAEKHIEVGDLVRGLTAYRDVVTGAPMWQQMASYTPIGKVQRKRLFFRTEGATYEDVRDAIASHKVEDGGDGVVTLVIERPLNSTTVATQPRDATPAGIEPLSDIIKRDLQRKAIKDEITEQVEKGLSPEERARRLLELGFEPPRSGREE